MQEEDIHSIVNVGGLKSVTLFSTVQVLRAVSKVIESAGN
jgi:hypothetical protein